MPLGRIGQLITFAAEIDPDSTYTRYVWIRANKGDTLLKIAARRGHPELAADLLVLNKGRDVLVHPKRVPGHKVKPVPKLRATTNTLRAGASLRMPGIMKAGEVLSVQAGNEAPTVKSGYAKYDIVAIPGRVGVNRFLGYDPLAIDVPIQFEQYTTQAGDGVEADIQKLERFAGRGDYPGAADGPPAVLRVSVTDNLGHIVPLIPPDYQWSRQHQHAPLWRISGIAWDAGSLRTVSGYRVRQTATVTITQYTPLVFVKRSVAQRTATIKSRSARPQPKAATHR
jgi:hypothetical protein